MKFKQLILITSLATPLALNAENPFEKARGNFSDNQALEVLQHENLHEHTDSVNITITIERGNKDDEAAWETIIRKTAEYAKRCETEEKEFSVREFGKFITETCEDLINSKLHGDISIALSESSQNDNHVKLGYEKS